MKKYLLFIIIILLFSVCSCGLRDVSQKTEATFRDVLTEPDETDGFSETDAPLPTDTVSETGSERPPETETELQSETETENAPAPTDAQTETEPPVVYPVGEYRPKAMMYHLIMETPYNDYTPLFVRPSDFDRQLSIIRDKGFEFLFADEWRLTERPSVILTFDDGYVDNYTDMFPILKKYGAKATVFLISELVGTDGYLSVDQVKEMAASGLVSFQCHTAHHVDLSYQDEATIRSEFASSIEKIESWTGRPVRSLAYPAGSYNDVVLRIAPEYFDFCYTTKSPNSVTEYSMFNIPRYYIARELTEQSFIYYLEQ